MSEKAKYRHELKYEIASLEYIPLRQRLRAVMKPDPHAFSNGRYTIRSLYFDNFSDKALREKLDGVAQREKFRIRFYNGDTSFIELEKKIKNNNLCMKTTCQISKSECEKLLAGDYSWMMESERDLIRELYAKLKIQQLRPRTIVSYTREPYIFAAGNVRVTFDSDIRTGLYCKDFFDPNSMLIKAAPWDQLILEVKFDDFLPAVIQDIIQIGVPRVQAFSKYAACRQFEY